MPDVPAAAPGVPAFRPVMAHFPMGAYDADAEVAAADAFRDAMARFPATVTVVATGSGDQRRGFTATAVFSVSMAPPLLGVCVNKSVDAHDLLATNRSFCVNVLGRDQEAIANRFAARDGSKGAVRFTADAWDSLVTGAPSLVTGSASMDCELIASVDVGTHTMILGRVRSVRLDRQQDPLLYFDRKFAVTKTLKGSGVPVAVSPIDGW